MKLFKINSKYLIVGTFLLLSATVCIAQSTKIKKWQYNQFDFGLGVDNDQYHRMSLNNLTALAENPDALKRDLSGMTEEISSSTAGLGLYFNRSYAPWSKEKAAYLSNQALRVGIGFHSPKESMITYKNELLDTSIVYCNLHSEFTFEFAYLWNGTWGSKKKFVWYCGVGTNASISLSNEMLLIEGEYFEPGAHPSTQESFEENTQRFLAMPVVYNRFYVPYGVHRVVGEHWSIGFDARRGFGVQTILGGKSNLINKTGTFMIGAKYRKGGF
ncbi:MAG: hypothetical protein ACI8SE_001105 [Bacteroidia bacterium]|jgi:hypothetical protein